MKREWEKHKDFILSLFLFVTSVSWQFISGIHFNRFLYSFHAVYHFKFFLFYVVIYSLFLSIKKFWWILCTVFHFNYIKILRSNTLLIIKFDWHENEYKNCFIFFFLNYVLPFVHYFFVTICTVWWDRSERKKKHNPINDEWLEAYWYIILIV